MKINYLDLFSGIGGFTLGIQQAGIELDWHGFSEIDKYAIKVYKERFQNAHELGTITAIDGRKLPKLNLITFGFPCQDLSMAGNRRGFKGQRSSLFFEAIRIIDENKPDYFIFENVKGLFSSNGGKDFTTVLRAIADIGYDGQWQLLNTSWLLPQNRERIYFVGHIRGKCRPEVFPIGTNGETLDDLQRPKANTITRKYHGGQATGSYIIERQQLPQTKGNSQGYRVYDTNGINQTLCGQSGGFGAKTGLYAIDPYNKKVITGTNATTLRTNYSNGNTQIVVAMRVRGENNTQTLEPNLTGKTNSLTSVQKDNLITDSANIRRLTPIECERLQGFPDNWTQSLSNSQRYKCLGNAVSVPVVSAVIVKLFNSEPA